MRECIEVIQHSANYFQSVFNKKILIRSQSTINSKRQQPSTHPRMLCKYMYD